MPLDYSNQNLQKASFKNADLREARFQDTDLRGADFTGSDLTGASFINVKTGIIPLTVVFIFFGALLVSAFSGYIAMLAGSTVQTMLASADWKMRAIGVATLVITVLFIAYTYWKGGRNALIQLIVPIFFFSIIVGGLSYFSGVGTGQGMLYELLVLVLVIVMLFVGTIARATAGTLSNLLFVVVALSGGMFGKSLGGGIGTVFMAISCAMISKRALSGAKGFETTRKIASYFTAKFGTSFRDCKMVNTDFSQSKIIRNADFSHADFFRIRWGNCKKINCIL